MPGSDSESSGNYSPLSDEGKPCCAKPRLDLLYSIRLFCIHGWPDDERCWDEVVDYYAGQKGYRCVTITMPHYAKSEGLLCSKWPRLGYNMDGIADLLYDALLASRRPDHPEDPLPLLFIHDWGSLYGFWLHTKYPQCVQAIVTFDIGFVDCGVVGPVSKSSIRKLNFYGCKYQFMLVVMWLINLLPVLGYILRLVFFLMGACCCGRHAINPASQYSYFYLQMTPRLEYISKTGYSGYPDWARNVDVTAWPSVPTILLYGKNKPFNFHEDGWLDGRGDLYEMHGMDAGHWIMHDDLDAAVGKIDSFLDKVERRRLSGRA
eukprot:TRINITY_DN6179_c0_g1_i12.p1 TRINITY_DN6179_c0_g1~~TRINITY_DN6179_c0_g1_i12.p1  ORF type:complete len:319 (-),score=14.17 TRINITY_DN6179_c0_g1_i12:153-1109(-)